MDPLAQSLAGRTPPARRAARKKRVAMRAAKAAFLAAWLPELDAQRLHARATGKFKSTTADNYTVTPSKSGFTLHFRHPTPDGDITTTATWDRKKARAPQLTWTSP